jgi:formylglycine-generating enzyme required for sulfatase activity
MSDDPRSDTPVTRLPEPGDERPRLAGADLQVGDRLGPFQLCEVLGQGGMGRVFRGVDEQEKREVAIKVMLPEIAADENLRRRFLREVKAMFALDHVHVVSIHYVDAAGPTPYFVMSLLRGETLQARLTREGVLPIGDVVRIGRQTAEGLAHAHERGLTHRDVKPLNLWLEEGTGSVKILDFGLARMDQESTSLTQTGHVLGTYGFLAPEQLHGGEVDHRCDQYQLGCVLYLLSTGKAATGRFRDPHDHNPAVPTSLSALIVRMLSQEPEGRYPSMREVARELAQLQPATSPASSRGGGMLTRPKSPAIAAPSLRVRGGLPQTFTNSIGMRFVLVEPGTFLMGSPPDEEGRYDDEGQHEVTLTRPFWLGVYQVTQGQWKAVMGSNPSHFSRTGGGKDSVEDVSDADLDLFPVESVSWQDAQAFLKKLAEMQQQASNGHEHRLPTEAEWEYACRGGHLIAEVPDEHTLPFHFERAASSLSSTQANFDGNYPYGGAARGPYLDRPCKVGSYRTNRLGIYDLHGNVWEWCNDWYAADYYATSPSDDPPGPDGGSGRAYRGGSWNCGGRNGRAANRYRGSPSNRNFNLGLRVAAVPRE